MREKRTKKYRFTKDIVVLAVPAEKKEIATAEVPESDLTT